jgi:O-antigen ligase
MKRLNKLLFRYVFFTAFPVIILVQNLSLFFFPFLVNGFLKRGNLFFKKTNIYEILIVLMSVGAVASTIATSTNPIEGAFARSAIILPNYFYWLFLLLFCSTYAKHFDYTVIYKAIFLGIISVIVYFYTMHTTGFYSFFFFLRSLPQNLFAFILICFSPIVVYYVRERYNIRFAVIVAIAIVLAGILSGSRSGSILTFITCSATLFATRISPTKLALGLVLFLVGQILLETPLVKATIFGLNERTYDIIYNRSEVLAKDESYLIRVAQVEKGIGLFKEHPLFGIGLGNYVEQPYAIKGDFEGYEIISKLNLENLSSHNSYINILSEGGLVVFAPFALILLGLVIYFIRNFNTMPSFQKPFFWGLLGMMFHFYFINAVVNVFAWLIIGLALTAVKYNSQK